MGSQVITPEIVTPRPLAPVPKPELVASKSGYVKVRLTYLTSEPKHLRSIVLAKQYGIQPPFHEEISILMPRQKVFTLLEAYLPAFNYLQSCSLVSKSARLMDFEIRDEDDLTLAHVL